MRISADQIGVNPFDPPHPRSISSAPTSAYQIGSETGIEKEMNILI